MALTFHQMKKKWTVIARNNFEYYKKIFKNYFPLVIQFKLFFLNKFFMHQYFSLSQKNEKLTKVFIDNCLKGYSKTVMFIFDNNLKKFLEQFCGEDRPERSNFIGWAKCGNIAKKRTAKCWNRLMTNLWRTRRIADSDDRIPSMCWSVFSLIFYSESYHRSLRELCLDLIFISKLQSSI